MSFPRQAFLRSLPHLFRHRNGTTKRRHRRLRFDRLEERAMLATFTVYSLDNSGPGTLREAIHAANNDSTLDLINFSVSGTIAPTSPLPPISHPVQINGGGNIELLGTYSATNNGFNGLEFISGSGSSVQGLAINRFFFGIVLRGPSTNTQIQNNFIGTDLSANEARPNFIGVGLLFGTSDNQIKNNVISGNAAIGIAVGAQSFVATGQEVRNTQITGNFIGTNSSGADLGNAGAGILLNSAESTQIGGIGLGEGNVIAFNNSPAISLGSAGGGHVAIKNSVRGNSIYENSDSNSTTVDLGIDLNMNGADGITANDTDPPAAPRTNNFQNYPVLWGAVAGSSTQLSGFLNSEPGKTFHIDFYANSTNDRQGRRYLGTATETTNSYGDVVFSYTAGATATGEFITATATDLEGSSSEFSAPILVSSSVATEVQVASTVQAQAIISGVNALPAQTDSPVTITVTLAAGTYAGITASPPPGVTLILNGEGGATFVGQSPALTVSSGTVIATNLNFANSTDASTILVTGGTLVLRNSTVHETTGGDRAALEIAGGSADLGTVADPGGNSLYTVGPGSLIRNPSYRPLSAIGNQYYVNGDLQSDGDVDPAFGDAGVSKLPLTFAPEQIVAAGNGRTLVISRTGEVVRLDQDGSVDTSFGTTAAHSIPAVFSSDPNRAFVDVAIDGDSLYLLRNIGVDLYVSKFDSAGQPDLGFGNAGTALVPFWQDDYYNDSGFITEKIIRSHITVSPAGIFVAATQWNAANPSARWTISLTRFTPDGQLDTAFGNSGIAQGPEVPSTANGNPAPRLRELVVNGNALVLMTTIHPASYSSFPHIYPEAVFSAFDFQGAALWSRNGLGRLVTEIPTNELYFDYVAVDDVYVPISANHFAPRWMALQGDKIVSVGQTGEFGYMVVRRYNSDGTVDYSFGTDGVVELKRDLEGTPQGEPSSISVTSDGRILILGTLGYWGYGSEEALLYRLNQDGTLDAEFGDNGLAVLDPRQISYAPQVIADPAGNAITLTRHLSASTSWISRTLGSISAPDPSPSRSTNFFHLPEETILVGEAVELTVTATDSDLLVEQAGFVYTINWGDGSAPTVVSRAAGNGAGVTVQHVYAGPGTYEVHLAAANADELTSESFASITVDWAAMRDAYLFVVGTTGDDMITLNTDNDELAVEVNGLAIGHFPLDARGPAVIPRGGQDTISSNWGADVYGTNGIDSITVNATPDSGFNLYGRGGDDTLTLNSDALFPIVIDGGPGADSIYLTAGEGSSTEVFAGAGDDQVTVNSSGSAYVGLSGGDGDNQFSVTAVDASAIHLWVDWPGVGTDDIQFAGTDDSQFQAGLRDGTSMYVVSTGTGGALLTTDSGAANVTVQLGQLLGPVVMQHSWVQIPDPTPDDITILGTDQADVIHKSPGLVTWGSPVQETITWVGEPASVSIYGGDGDDTIIDPGQNTFIYGGLGSDTITVNATTGNGVFVDGGSGADTYLIGGGQIGDLAGPVTITDTGTTGGDTITVLGTSGDDSIAQTSAGFQLNNTPVSVTGLESATVDGGGGADAVEASGVPPVPVQVTGVADMIVIGTNGNDHILFQTGDSPGQVIAWLNGVIVSQFAPTGKLVAAGGDGDDNIQVAGGIALAAWLYGEAGNDRLNAGAGGSLLIGGEGNDELLGGTGRDIMVGGQGADRLLGNSNDDILIAGFTLRDDRFAAGHLAFWQSVFAEWNSSHSFTARVNNLKGSNSAYTGVRLLPEVRDDLFADEIDFLNGGAGDDWVIFQVGEDKVTGQTEATN